MFIYSLVLFLSFVLTFPFSPLVFRSLNRDAGIFLYIAQQVLKGGLPYRDFWDHKGPLIYYLNAIGLKFGGLWGVWFLHFLVFFISGVLFFKIISLKFKDRYLYILGLIIFYLQISALFYEFDQVEIFSIIFQLAFIYLFLVKRDSFKIAILCGIFAGLSSLLRPNLIGFFIAGVIFVFLFSKKPLYHRFNAIISLIFGFVIPWFLFFWYFYLRDGLFDFIDQVILYNILYIKTPLILRLHVLTKMFEYLNNGKSAYFLMAGVLLYLFDKRFFKDKESLYLLLVFLFEGFFVLLSGRDFSHYFYLVIFPSTYFTLYFFNKLFLAFPSRKYGFIFFFLLSFFSLPFLKQSFSKAVIHYNGSQNSNLLKVVDFLKEKSRQNDKILVWGADPSINFLSQRVSPTRYFYQYAIFTPVYGEEAYEEFLQEIKKEKPQFIVDITAYTSKVIPLDSKRRKYWNINSNYKIPSKINMFLEFVEKNYKMIKLFNDIAVYKLK